MAEKEMFVRKKIIGQVNLSEKQNTMDTSDYSVAKSGSKLEERDIPATDEHIMSALNPPESFLREGEPSDEIQHEIQHLTEDQAWDRRFEPACTEEGEPISLEEWESYCDGDTVVGIEPGGQRIWG